MEEEQLPYRAEYAKSGRALCKGCKNTISKDSLRLAVMVQSPFFDGKQPNWYHFSCFFGKFRPKNTSDIAHFESIRWDDQEAIRKKIASPFEDSASEVKGCKSKSSKSKKRSITSSIEIPDLGDYTVEYSKSKRAKCKVCEETIDKNVIRISKKDYEGEQALKFGPINRWHHVDCFVKARHELNFFGSAKILPGFKTLTDEDQKDLLSKIPELAKNESTGPSPPKKIKSSEDDTFKKKLKKQNDTMFKYHDLLQSLKKSDLQLLLEFNNQEIPEGTSRMIERITDGMTFGALDKCEKCKGQLHFSSGKGYICLGYVNEWLKCDTVNVKPSRCAFKIPHELKENYDFLKKFKGKVEQRLFNDTAPINQGSSKNGLALSNLKFFIHKTDEKTSDDIKKQILNLGGTTVKKFEEDIAAVISTSRELKNFKNSKTLKAAEKSEVPVLPESFFYNMTNSTTQADVIAKISETKLSTWNFDPSKYKTVKEETTVKKSVYPAKELQSGKSKIFKSNETVKKVTLKDGLVVDPDSKLDKVAHVYRKGKDIYSCVLNLVDIQRGKNSYYKIQILESDKKNKYWIFKAWGRTGTTIGGNKCEQYDNLNDCIDLFKETFEEQTGNLWDKRKNFKKVPGKKIMLDIDYNEPEKNKEKEKVKLDSKILSNSVQSLITLIFDIEAMKRTMLEFELDLNKMPLGKLSQKQILSAFKILTNLQDLTKANAEKGDFIEKTNMFYSLVPHDFGINSPPLLDKDDIIKQKIDMLNSLMDIEIAYKLLQECESSENSIDDHYKKLNTEIIDLNPETEEYKMIELYVKNTHAKTHMNYSLKIENVFKIKRKGESQRYKKFSKFSNRKLLWHGSRITNFAGILSQGLRIAPPEAPVTGYMFGKGIYFADMVSKSANYCNTSKKNNTGLLLLCEVALGEMLELTHAKDIIKPPSGKNSVKGVGRTQPDPSQVIVSPTGVEVPVGKGVDANIKDSSLLYNEYIVYDVDQVKIQYLLRLKFNYNL